MIRIFRIACINLHYLKCLLIPVEYLHDTIIRIGGTHALHTAFHANVCECATRFRTRIFPSICKGTREICGGGSRRNESEGERERERWNLFMA